MSATFSKCSLLIIGSVCALYLDKLRRLLSALPSFEVCLFCHINSQVIIP